jgi:8-oxo-dGTP pyrophosphatase MutT (NUDIX family)
MQRDDPVPPRHAASVVLIRDSAEGLQVLLQRRHQNAGVLGGLYVFPGGKLDDADHDDGWQACIDLDPASLPDRLNEADASPAQALGLHVAALRELHEEAGILLATPAEQACLHTLALAATLRAGADWPASLLALGLRAHLAGLRAWSRWITPRNPPVGTPRFDTRFFLACLPAGQDARHDDHEAVESVWLTPRQALQRYWAGEIGLLPPQLMALAQLSHHARVDRAWDEAGQRRAPCIQPEHFLDGTDRAMCYPGDPLHSLAQRALPGPTRLRLRQGRFEPFGGFEAWFT